MRKFIIVIILMLTLINGQDNVKDFSLLDYFDGAYISYTSAEQNDSVDLGFCYMNEQIEDREVIVGESMTIENFEVSSAISDLKAKVIKTEYLEDGTTVIYAYTKLIKDQVKINDQKVNLQIAYKEEYSVIGWPLILGSF